MAGKRKQALVAVAFTTITLSGCWVPTVPNDPDAKLPLRSAPTWRNWSENLVHQPARSGEYYYFAPISQAELATIIGQADAAGIQVRVSGQRHTQAPLVADDNRGNAMYRSDTWLVDLSCYADLGADGNEQVVVDQANNLVTVNTGVREDYLSAELAVNDLILKTETAGGFFSIGGITAIDAHGATMSEPIIAETVTAFSIMGSDGTVTTITQDDPAIDFARVSLGALGVVTSVTFEVQQRPYADSLQSGRKQVTLNTAEAFVQEMTTLINEHQRLEIFYNPYFNQFDVLWWNVVQNPPGQQPNKSANNVATACTYAENDSFGSPYEPKWIEAPADWAEPKIQLSRSRLLAEGSVAIALAEINAMFDRAQKAQEDLWLTQAARAIFMSYFVELPELDEAGLTKVWDALQVVRNQLEGSKEFLLASPLEFRFIKGGTTALASTYSDDGANTTFVNLDMIGFVEPVSSSDYPQRMLDFFATIEKSWYGDFEGRPHNGKMYGFHDPATGATTPPFSKAFLDSWAERRADQLERFSAYRAQRDPDGRFCNSYLRAYGVCPE